MDYSGIRIFSLMKMKMDYHAENQDLLAQNIAHADTPGFTPRELKAPDFKRMALNEAHRLKVRMTSAAHLAGSKTQYDFRVAEQRKSYETTPVDNGIALEEQMAKVAYNKHEYLMTANLYTKTAQLFRTAIGNN